MVLAAETIFICGYTCYWVKLPLETSPMLWSQLVLLILFIPVCLDKLRWGVFQNGQRLPELEVLHADHAGKFRKVDQF